MSYNDRTDGISSAEWQNRLEAFELKQVDVNKLIMNYLITEGENLSLRIVFVFISTKINV